jgi:hypothetical protein
MLRQEDLTQTRDELPRPDETTVSNLAIGLRGYCNAVAATVGATTLGDRTDGFRA